MSQEVHLEDETDRWKWVCPNGHRSWEPTNNHFWCQTCSRQRGVDGEFSELHDKATDETYDRDELRLVTPAGPYEDLRRESGSA